MGNGTPRFVLSIDGGGFRGLACLQILRHLTEDITGDDETPPCQIFDLICGTSTGGLIAILLGRFGLTCKEAIKVYKELGATMFGGEADWGRIWRDIIQGDRLSSTMFEKKLEEITERYTGRKDALMKPGKRDPDTVVHESTKTFVTVVSTIGSAGVDAYRIRSYPRPRGGVDPSPDDHGWTIFEGVRGTCATPLYFPPLQIQSGRTSYTFQDAGSSGFNNPAKIAINEAEKLFAYDATITLVSLGAGLRNLLKDGQFALGAREEVTEKHVESYTQQILSITEKLVTKIHNAPEVAKRVAHQLLEVATDTEISHLHVSAQFESQDQQQNYHRFNPPQGLGDIELADCSKEVEITETTRAWLNSADGKHDISLAVDKMKLHYELQQT